MRFEVRKINFGCPPAADDDDEGQDLPGPKLLKLKARRAAGIREAAETLAHLPGPGESLHALCTSRLDLADIIGHLLERVGRCTRLSIGTLGYNARNLRTMLSWLDTGAVKELTLLASLFFRSHNAQLWQHTLEEFRARKQRAACAASHAKVVTMEFVSGERYTIEGSSNLCGNGSAREQFALINSPELCAWHTGWIDNMVSHYEGSKPTTDQRTG
jgi:hypothetical protein